LQPAHGASPSAADEAQANERKARSVIDKMIQALGGQAYLSLGDLQGEVRFGVFHHGTPGGTDVYFRYWQWPDKERREFTADRDVIVIHNGDKGYE